MKFVEELIEVSGLPDIIDNYEHEVYSDLEYKIGEYYKYLRMGRRLYNRMHKLEDSRIALQKFKDSNVYIERLDSDKGQDVYKFPIVPVDFQLSSPFKKKKVQTVTDFLSFMEKRDLQSISWSSFFPGNFYIFSKENKYFSWDYVRALEEIRDLKVPVRLVITRAGIVMEGYITEFTPKNEANEDVSYSLTFEQRKKIEVKSIVAGTTYYKPKEVVKPQKKIDYSQIANKKVVKNWGIEEWALTQT